MELGTTTPLDTVDAGLIQHRVGNVGLVLAAIGGVFVVMRVATLLTLGRLEHLGSTSMVSHYAGVAASVAMWLVCWKAELSARATHAVELVGLTLVCSVYAVMATGIPQAFRPEMTLLLAFGVFLLAHAVHVPSTWQWTALLASALAVPLIVGSWNILTPMDPRIVAASASAAGSVQRSPESIIGIGMASVVTWWLVIAGTASTASSVIYGLRREVRQARELGQYSIVRKLGEGGMAVVYLANHRMLRRPTAVKVFLPEKVGEKGLVRFEREVRATARLSHPNTVTIFDYGRTADGLFYYAMEYLEGVSLDEVVQMFGPMPPGRVIHVLHQVAGALSEAHALGLLHRDIKPANVMLTRQGGEADVAKVVDFGLVKTVSGVGELNKTSDDTLVGTPQFLAPEVIEGTGEDSPARDLYALGCVAYHLAAGRPVFTGKTVIETCLAHISKAPEPPSTYLDAPLPRDLEALILELLAKDPKARPPSASALRERLAACEAFGSWTQHDATLWWQQHETELREKHPPLECEPYAATALAIDVRGRSGG